MTQLARFAIPGLLALAAAHPMTAQGARKVHLGVTAGLNFATWRGSDVGSGAKTRTGVHLGATAGLDLNQAFSLQSGLVYSQEGTGADVGTGVSGAIEADYLRIPLYLLAGTTLSGTTPIRPYLYAGPAVSFKVRCRLSVSSGGQSAQVDCDDPSVGLKLSGSDFALHFGGGVGVGHFTLNGRYQLGLSSIDGTDSKTDIKNSVFALSASYSF